MLKRVLSALALGICLLAVPAVAGDAIPKVGDEVAFRFVCHGEALVEKQIDTIYETHATEKANAMLKEAIEAGECILLPGPMSDTVKEVGKVRGTYKNSNGNTVRITAVRVGDEIWTGYVEFADDET